MNGKLYCHVDGRRYRLLKRGGDSCGPWYLRFKVGGRAIWRSLGTADDAAAIAKATDFVLAEKQVIKQRIVKALSSKDRAALEEIILRRIGLKV